MNASPAHAFVGWRRTHHRGRWFAVAWGDTYAECWDALLRVATLGSAAESIVLEAGRTPDERKPFRRGVR